MTATNPQANRIHLRSFLGSILKMVVLTIALAWAIGETKTSNKILLSLELALPLIYVFLDLKAKGTWTWKHDASLAGSAPNDAVTSAAFSRRTAMELQRWLVFLVIAVLVNMVVDRVFEKIGLGSTLGEDRPAAKPLAEVSPDPVSGEEVAEILGVTAMAWSFRDVKATCWIELHDKDGVRKILPTDGKEALSSEPSANSSSHSGRIRLVKQGKDIMISIASRDGSRVVSANVAHPRTDANLIHSSSRFTGKSATASSGAIPPIPGLKDQLETIDLYEERWTNEGQPGNERKLVLKGRFSKP